MTTMRDAEVTELVDGRHWRVVLGRLEAVFRTGSFARGAELVRRLAAVADDLDHHPDVILRYPSVLVRTVTHDAGGLTERDVRLAAAVSALADELGIEPDATAPQVLEVAIDALDIPSVVPFWRAVLGYEDERIDADDASPALVDPRGVGPSVWFQQMDEPRPQRNRIHLDVTVPHDAAEVRVAAAVAAGGRLVSDARAPAFWVLADVEGNEACVCTWQARD
ncbi:VOC family protein [Actinotalea solisilvae]|uniref:VOC family protein n=1 Tax=Actinotalea solisilvae TaxID=2072922 RepID=UPI0018F272AC|nr:VOC family protein [Actinotalea solisilvae]